MKIIPDEKLKEICKMGQGECCRYTNQMTARGNNCEGL